MKALLFALALASVSFAQTPAVPPQVPAHSVVGTLTIDVVDIQVPVPYGPDEKKAVISVCSSQEVSSFELQLAVDNLLSNFYRLPAVKTATAYCATVVSIASRAKTSSIDAVASTLVSVTPSPTSGSTAARQR